MGGAILPALKSSTNVEALYSAASLRLPKRGEDRFLFEFPTRQTLSQSFRRCRIALHRFGARGATQTGSCPKASFTAFETGAPRIRERFERFARGL
jgi:hypothetical protein